MEAKTAAKPTHPPFARMLMDAVQAMQAAEGWHGASLPTLKKAVHAAHPEVGAGRSRTLCACLQRRRRAQCATRRGAAGAAHLSDTRQPLPRRRRRCCA